MKKDIETWTIDDLQRRFLAINFPEYQREPNIWSLYAKRRLIDSILRRFDIASLYFYRNDDGSLDCIDGRQRINAIMAFLGRNHRDEDNDFSLKVINEIYEEKKHPFKDLEGKSFGQIEALKKRRNKIARNAIDTFLQYEVTFVLLSEATEAEEFNLQFTRLNVGTMINAGEKLHAMVGRMPDMCFDDDRIGRHPFLDVLSIPSRRYAKEQVAAQILAQVFSIDETSEFTKARHYDLQRFLKAYAELSDSDEELISEVTSTFDALAKGLRSAGDLLGNRAIAVTTVLVAWRRKLYRKSKEMKAFAQFVDAFVCRLRWQVRQGLDVDQEYRYLIDFQRHVTQASVERPAVEARFEVMEAEFDRWLKDGRLLGDKDFKRRTKREPDEACREGR